jgi:hypothetical protein
MKFFVTNNKGQAIVLSYLVITAFIMMTAGLLTRAMTDNYVTERNQLTSETLYLAEGATENAIKTFSSALANFVIPTSTASYNVSTTFTTFGGAVVNTVITQMETSDRSTVDALGRNVYARLYEAVSAATHPQNASISITVHQIFERKLIPTFQHMIFYNDDLEVLPGPNMTLSGRIHGNNDIYMDCRNTLTIDTTYLHSAANIYNQRKENVGDLMGGNVSIRVSGGGFANMNDLDSDVPTWGPDATTRWNGTVQSSVHGVTSLVAPSVGTTDPAGYYATNANVVITDNTIVKNGVTLTEGVDYPTGTVSSSSAFYNNREGKFVKMTTVDVAKLSGLSGTCGGGACPNNLPSNGLLYATRTDAGALQPGIKLVNGTQIPNADGLTVVSNAPVYIKGDYNTVDETPTSVISDALNLLSNNWSDANSTLNLTSRNANTTTYNCAFVAGISTSVVGGIYNGGLENYPRLHEGWSGITMNIKGSFVELWNSAIATGNWAYGAPYYTAPSNRNWNYNTAFNNPSNLPPFTPMAVEAQRVAWWQD